MQIISHRGNLRGPQPKQENEVDYLLRAFQAGFGVELDVRADLDSGKLVLSHDAGIPWSPSRDAVKLLGKFSQAVNVKELHAVRAMERCLTADGLAYMFDFELVGEVREVRFLMKSLSCPVAYRPTTRQDLIDLLKCRSIDRIWIDSSMHEWLDGLPIGLYHPQVCYVNARDKLSDLIDIWRVMSDIGVAAICTDYPIACREVIDEGSDTSRRSRRTVQPERLSGSEAADSRRRKADGVLGT